MMYPVYVGGQAYLLAAKIGRPMNNAG